MSTFTPQRWFIGDLHDDHKFILSNGGRSEFQTVDQMREHLIADWNAKVDPRDEVYILGDVTFSSQPLDFIDRLNGQLFLVPGNHDKKLMSDRHALTRFNKVDKIMNVKIDDPDGQGGRQLIILCHFPLIVWEQVEYGAWHLHGHCHGSLQEFEGKRLDVSADSLRKMFREGYGPVSYDQVKAYMRTRSIGVYDHHAPKPDKDEHA